MTDDKLLSESEALKEWGLTGTNADFIPSIKDLFLTEDRLLNENKELTKRLDHLKAQLESVSNEIAEVEKAQEDNCIRRVAIVKALQSFNLHAVTVNKHRG